MNTLLIVRADILSIIILLSILIYDSSFHKQYGTKGKFTKFAVTVLLFSIFGFITEITVNSDTVPKLLNDVCHLIYFLLSLIFCFFYFEYVLSYTSTEKQRKMAMTIAATVIAISVVIMAFSEIEYLQGSGTKYSWGTGVKVGYTVGFFMFLVTDIVMIAKRKTIPKHIVNTLFPFSIVSLILMFIQIFIPEFLFVESDLTILAIGVYLSLESPIYKAQELKALAKKIDVERMMFRDAIDASALYTYVIDADEGFIVGDVVDKNGVDILALVDMQAPAKADEYVKRLIEKFDPVVQGVSDISMISCAGIRRMYEEGRRRDQFEIHYTDADMFLRLMPLLYVDPDTNHLMCHCVCEDITDRRRKQRYMREQLRKTLEVSLTDEITGLFNRHAYENTIKSILDSSNIVDYAVVTADINGLKEINDNLGHIAGDELISGAASCLRKGLSQYGQIYRMGGDEFTAILYNMSEKKLNDAIRDTQESINEWRGETVERLSMSYGYVLSTELEGANIIALQKLADKRMYESKNEYYRENGLDRRNQGNAFDAIYATHNHMVKINVTDDSHTSYKKYKVDAGAKSLSKGSEINLRKFTAAGTYSDDGKEITLYIKDEVPDENQN